jgi:hypothetical protein
MDTVLDEGNDNYLRHWGDAVVECIWPEAARSFIRELLLLSRERKLYRKQRHFVNFVEQAADTWLTSRSDAEMAAFQASSPPSKAGKLGSRSSDKKKDLRAPPKGSSAGSASNKTTSPFTPPKCHNCNRVGHKVPDCTVLRIF